MHFYYVVICTDQVVVVKFSWNGKVVEQTWNLS